MTVEEVKRKKLSFYFACGSFFFLIEILSNFEILKRFFNNLTKMCFTFNVFNLLDNEIFTYQYFFFFLIGFYIFKEGRFWNFLRFGPLTVIISHWFFDRDVIAVPIAIATLRDPLIQVGFLSKPDNWILIEINIIYKFFFTFGGKWECWMLSVILCCEARSSIILLKLIKIHNRNTGGQISISFI
jgi:hypothetical protein